MLSSRSLDCLLSCSWLPKQFEVGVPSSGVDFKSNQKVVGIPTSSVTPLLHLILEEEHIVGFVVLLMSHPHCWKTCLIIEDGQFAF